MWFTLINKSYFVWIIIYALNLSVHGTLIGFSLGLKVVVKATLISTLIKYFENAMWSRFWYGRAREKESYHAKFFAEN